MTASDFRSWLKTLAEAEATVPARQVFDRLPEDGDKETPQADPSPLGLNWREKLWLAAAGRRDSSKHQARLSCPCSMTVLAGGMLHDG